ncbi:SUMO-specific isopeptidase USPL1 [Trichomycterus rosablanca]|uniref:SUMO-specific isopeptidase USPL1 n=1 Tax=Trichomycterus rosablanca TaxID=2290929 RepID=UPI002F350553
MVINSWWMEPKSKSRPMNGEGCGLSVPSPAQAWYLGKAKDRGLFGENCPCCSAKGQTNVLRSYAINFEESITICTSPQCLYPLVSKPLDYNHDTISSSQDVKKIKRNFTDDLNQSPKRRKKESDNVSEDTFTVDLGDDDESATSYVDELFDNSCKEQKEIGKHDKNTCAMVCNGTNGAQGPSHNAQIINPVSSTQDEKCKTHQGNVAVDDLIEMVPTRPHLFWRNTNNLCWLNSLLVALVHFRAFRKSSYENVGLADDIPNIMRNFCVRFNQSCANLRTKEQLCQGNIVRVPSGVLQKTEQDMEALRDSVLQLLQPKLKYELGQQETPVFALPLLLDSDNWAYSLLQHTGQWEFKCTKCGYNLNTSVEKTVTTFTEIVADWHPLRAVHRTQCNNCLCKKQRRKLVLQRLSSVLALHFVEGLPRRDVSRYSFDFEGTHYNIKTIIQYNKQHKHFATWIHQPDGTWLEFDDLKYPHCTTHKRFTLPANQFHLVFWEAELKQNSGLSEHLPAENTTLESTNEGNRLKDTDDSLPDDVCIVKALTLNDTKNEDANTLDSSIGSTTLLDTFEGLSHSDIITLTLVEVDEMDAKEPLPTSQESVIGPAEPSVTKKCLLPEETSLSQTSNLINNKISCAQNISSTPDIVPSVVMTSTAASQVSQCQPTLHSSNPNSSHLSFLLKQHPSRQSTPLCSSRLKPDLRSESNEALPFKPAELFGGYRAKNSPNSILPEGQLKNQLVKPLSQKPLTHPGGNTAVQAFALPKSTNKDNPNLSPSKTLSTTDLLRLKLMKKLKAKKKKLAKLNQLLYKDDSESTPKPDSTRVCSPYSVTSAYNSPAYDHFLSELLSPPLSASTLSPDSTDFLEKLTNSQGAGPLDCTTQENSIPAQSDFSSSTDNFLDEFISESELHQSVHENTDLNALDIFF